MSPQCAALPPQAPHLAAGWAEKERAGGPWPEALPSPGLHVTLWQLHFLSPTERPEEQTEHAFVNILTRGDLSSIRWVCSPLRHAQPTGSGVQLCTIYYASLNFRDIMLATGKLSPDAIPGTGSTQWGDQNRDLRGQDLGRGGPHPAMLRNLGGSSNPSSHTGVLLGR